MKLQIECITKKYENYRAVNNISYTMTNGIYGLLGVNGAGKTTLMKMLCTLLRPSSGAIYYDGRDIRELDSEYCRILGYLPQDFGYYPYFTAEQYLMRIALLKGLSEKKAIKRVELLLEKVDLIENKKKRIKTFSGGMIRRLGIAQAMLNDPKILILDEPTAGLDPNERIRFKRLISELSQEKIVLLSTHIVSDVEDVANEIMMMKKGKFEFCGSREKLLSNAGISAWKCVVNEKKATQLEEEYKISNVKREKDLVELKILSKKCPCVEAVQEIITLEDIFLYYFDEMEENANDIL